MEPLASLGRLASRLLSDDSVFATLQRTLLSTLDARRAVDRNIERVLAALNVPSAHDFERVIGQLRDLDRDLTRLTERVGVLAEELEASRRAERER